MRKIAALALATGLATAACSSAEPGPSRADPFGPPRVQSTVVARHARELDGELASRPAGSQEEQIASQYVLGHLQRAGYAVRLESVPVANTVSSVNLEAFPPSGSKPDTLVTVAIDAKADADPWGYSVGTFLEVARALYAGDAEHRVEFVALGAERTTDHRGSRRLAQQLIDQAAHPFVVTIAGVDSAGEASLGFRGDGAEEIAEVASEMGFGATRADLALIGGVDVFAKAGFSHLLVTGPDDELGPVLLAWLQSGAD